MVIVVKRTAERCHVGMCCIRCDDRISAVCMFMAVEAGAALNHGEIKLQSKLVNEPQFISAEVE